LDEEQHPHAASEVRQASGQGQTQCAMTLSSAV